MLLGRIVHTITPAGCRIGAWVVVTVLVPLPILAFASPPDPVWVPGIYDGADGDDIVTLVTETVASEDGVPCQLRFPALSPEAVVGRDPVNYDRSRILPPARFSRAVESITTFFRSPHTLAIDLPCLVGAQVDASRLREGLRRMSPP